MTDWLTEEQQTAWRGWLDAHSRLMARLNRDLQASHGLSIADYELLVALTDDPERAIRMRDLGEKVAWEKSRLSKHVSRMEARGLVARRDCADDRRGAFVELTDAGLTAIRAAAPGHVDLVRTIVFDGLTPDQVRTLADLTAQILARLDVVRRG